MASSSLANFGHVVYDSGSEGGSGRRRIGTSATEIEMLDDIPRSSSRTTARSANFVPTRSQAFDRQKSPLTSPNAFQPVSSRREEPKPKMIYEDANDQQLGSAVDRLLERYAPDATPHNVFSASTSRRPIGQSSTNAAREEAPKPTFQTPGPAPSTASHNYSTIIRPTSRPIPQSQTPIIANNGNPPGPPAFTQQPPSTIYDSFHHVMPQPPSQLPQQQQRSAPIVPTNAPMRANNGNAPHVVPGVLYNLDDDPLHLLLERQKPASSNQRPAAAFTAPPPPPTQPPFMNTTFQPSYPFATAQDPLTALLNGLSQQYPSQAIPTTTSVNPMGPAPFDLGDLIKRVQQDYLREIQPFVSSVKFVEKDREYGQGLGDVGFTTPVSVRKGFRKQADEMLRQGFGREERQRKESDSYTYSDDSDEEEESTSSVQIGTNDKMASKESFTSVTSVSSASTDVRKNARQKSAKGDRKQMHSQGTSPPPAVKPQTTAQPAPEQKSTPSTVPTQSLSKLSSDDNRSVTTTASRPIVPKKARRVPSDERSDDSSDADTDSAGETSTAKYNEHTPSVVKPPNPIAGADAVVTLTPVVKPDEETARRRANEIASASQRSENIHPKPPTLGPRASNQTTPTAARSTVVAVAAVESDSDTVAGGSESENVSDSDEDKPIVSIPVPTMPQATTQRVVPSSPSVQPPTPSSTARTTAPQTPASTAQQTPTIGGATQRTATANTPNLPFIPAAQRNPTAATSQNPVATGSAQTGSTRFFASDADNKANRNRAGKDKPSLGTRLKSMFRRS